MLLVFLGSLYKNDLCLHFRAVSPNRTRWPLHSLHSHDTLAPYEYKPHVVRYICESVCVCVGLKCHLITKRTSSFCHQHLWESEALTWRPGNSARLRSNCLRRPEQVPARGWNDKSCISAYKSFILGINSPRLYYHRQTDCCICPLTKQSLLFNPDTSICYDTVSICQEMWMERRDAEGGGYSLY